MKKKKNVKLAMVLGIIISDKNEALISHWPRPGEAPAFSLLYLQEMSLKSHKKGSPLKKRNNSS